MQHDPQRPQRPPTNLRPIIIASIVIAVASLIVLCMLTITIAAVQTTSR